MLRFYPRNPLRIPADRLKKIHDHYEYDPALPVSNTTYTRALVVRQRRAQVNAERLRGWEGHRFVCYFWWQGWRHINLGFHIHLGDPLNVELHIPFGFIRIGLTGTIGREVAYERILCEEIIRRYEEWTDLELAMEAQVYGTPRLPIADGPYT